MKVIFLDIDGVLNTNDNIIKQVNENNGKQSYQYQFNFDPQSMKNLQEIVLKSDAKIVVTSTWRLHFGVDYSDRDDYINYEKSFYRNMEEYGILDSYIGITPRFCGEIRGKEIQSWLNENEKVTHFLILDDDSDMGDLMPHLVCIDGEIGITRENVKKALLLLEGENNETNTNRL